MNLFDIIAKKDDRGSLKKACINKGLSMLADKMEKSVESSKFCRGIEDDQEKKRIKGSTKELNNALKSEMKSELMDMIKGGSIFDLF